MGAGMSRELPILFNGEMVRAILDGRKVETRRPVKHVPALGQPEVWCPDVGRFSPFGDVGTLLYVRETFHPDEHDWAYRVDWPAGHPDVDSWRPSIHMPKRAARIWLRVLEVRVERVHEITEEGARREGMQWGRLDMTTSPPTESQRRRIFSQTWDSIYAAQDLGWDLNPWVWVCRFEVVSTTGRPA